MKFSSPVVTGLPQLDRAMKALKADIRDRIIRGAMRKALEKVEFDAKRKVAKGGTGRLEEAIKKSTKLNIADAVVMGSVYVKRKGKDKAPHSHLVEFGTGERFATHTWKHLNYVTVKGQSFGRMRAEPFMTPTFEKNKRLVPLLFRDYLRKQIAKRLRRKK